MLTSFTQVLSFFFITILLLFFLWDGLWDGCGVLLCSVFYIFFYFFLSIGNNSINGLSLCIFHAMLSIFLYIFTFKFQSFLSYSSLDNVSVLVSYFGSTSIHSVSLKSSPKKKEANMNLDRIGQIRLEMRWNMDLDTMNRR